MESLIHRKGLSFNESIFKEYEADGWKFLQEMDPISGEMAGFLFRSPYPVLGLTFTYIIFVCFIGPSLMQNREPFQLKNLIRFYNLLMVLLAGVLLANLLKCVGSFATLFDCDKTFNLSDPSSSGIYGMANFILLVRLSEYLDTIFFTLRKKQNQVTFLHVFHHAFVPIYAFWILRTAPLRFNVFIILVNSFIHVLMYFYYFLATFQQPRDGPGARNRAKQGPIMYVVTKLLMFKKYMTQLQILQFIALAAYSIWATMQPNKCQVPWTYIIANLLLALGFLSLFLHFYVQVYRKGASTKTKRD